MVDINKSNNPPPLPTVTELNTLADYPLLTEPNRLSAGIAVEWLRHAWGIFKDNIALWLGAGLLVIILQIGSAYIPIIGGIISAILSFVCSAGVAYMAHRQTTEGDTSIGDLFVAFRHNFKSFVFLYLWLLLITLVLVILLIIIGFAIGINLDMVKQGDIFGSGVLILIAVAILLFIPLSMAVWLAPILILFHDVKALQALKMSFKGCMANLLPLTVFGLIGMILGVIAVIPFGLGWFVLVPVMMIVSYVAYRYIYTQI